MARKTAKKQAEAPKVDIGAEIFASLRELEKLKGIPVDYMVERLKQALTNAYRKDREDHRDVPAENVVVNLSEEGLSMYQIKTVVDELTDLALEKKRLAVEQLKLRLQQEEARLGELLDTTPNTPISEETVSVTYDYVDMEVPVEEDPITELKVISDEKNKKAYPGTKENPVICLFPNMLSNLNDETMGKVKDEIIKKRKEADKKDNILLPESEYAISEFYAVIKTTMDNLPSSGKVLWQGIHVLCSEKPYSLQFFDASGILDFSILPERTQTISVAIPNWKTETAGDDIGTGGYTKEQLTRMIEDQRKTILDVKYKIKVAEAEYSIARRETNDGNIYSEVDGKVVSVLTQEEAKENQQPILKVSGGGGFYVSGSISELNRDKLQIGSEVTITDYQNGGVYTGTVESVGDFPASGDNYYGNGNPNVSYYPFTVFVDESADLVGGNYVNIQYSLNQEDGGIYLSNPFVRKENGESYVFVRDENGRLEKRAVKTGKGLWGSYIEILSGITTEDKLAFPYGKNVKPGAATAEGDYSTLYEQ